MEFVKSSPTKDRFIKSSCSNISEHFNTKWEINQEIDTTDYSSIASEEDENKAYRAMLQSEVLKIDPEIPEIEDSSSLWKSDGADSSTYGDIKRKEMYSTKPIFGRTKEKISKAPFKVLDAPALKDDFYLNLIDWSSQNILAVALSSCIYMWNASTSKVTKLYDLGSSDVVTSVSWSEKFNLLGVGTNKGEFQIWDPEKCKCLKTLGGHESRIGAISWNDSLVSTGSRDKSILHRDIRSD
eukprot:CAMPEP_0197011300 /NCGR_PEP_ID=MMETSP1380-20130617/57937_1 /TAXON_ID=5936 /ORGANISM="Euplotes crassus, Strain CT5" /LENGTH=239 /DNA_ID=CAMNT_0042433905 /DNA_START=6 /DNA_END=725 /DNA_ORIENTATION=+